MRNGVIQIITYTFVLMIAYILDVFIERKAAVISLTFMLGWFTYPLIKWLQKDE
jgi:hypothetical protein